MLVALGVAKVDAAPDAAAGARKAETCVGCHGVNGNPIDAAIPSLAGQTPLYIFYQLLQFREGRRPSPTMAPLAANISDADMKDIAAFFAAQKPFDSAANSTPVPGTARNAVPHAGEAVAARNHCGSCHMPNFTGQKHIPRLAGLRAEYLAAQLRGYKTGGRQDIDGSMASAAQPLSEKDIIDVADYLAAMKY